MKHGSCGSDFLDNTLDVFFWLLGAWPGEINKSDTIAAYLVTKALQVWTPPRWKSLEISGTGDFRKGRMIG